MFSRLHKIRKVLNHVIFSKWVWVWPKQSDILIFDACNQDLLLQFLDPWSVETLYVRGEQTNMRVLISSIFKSGDKTEAYLDHFISKVSPRLVITFIDNNINFIKISHRHSNVKTLLIQNGWRFYYEDLCEALDKIDPTMLEKLKVDYMMLFGCLVGEEYSKYIAGAVVPIGSVKSNLIPKSPDMEKGVIAYISTWQKISSKLKGKLYTEKTYLIPVDRTIISNLLHYSKEKNKRLMIIPRNPKHSELRDQEEKHFRELLDQEPEFFDQLGPYPSYRALDYAEVVVGVDSTLCYESIARGNKTAIFSIRGELLGLRGFSYGWPENFPDEGSFWTNKPCPENFYRILDYLFSVEYVQWQKDVEATNFSSLMKYDKGNSVFKSTLEKIMMAPIETKNI
jgi:surface carbohydrate biosynthesis protein